MACLYHVKVKGGALRGNKDGSQLACVLLSIPDTKKNKKYVDDYCNDDKLSEWYDGYKKRKAQKARIEEELMPIAWHPSKYWD